MICYLCYLLPAIFEPRARDPHPASAFRLLWACGLWEISRRTPRPGTQSQTPTPGPAPRGRAQTPEAPPTRHTKITITLTKKTKRASRQRCAMASPRVRKFLCRGPARVTRRGTPVHIAHISHNNLNCTTLRIVVSRVTMVQGVCRRVWRVNAPLRLGVCMVRREFVGARLAC